MSRNLMNRNLRLGRYRLQMRRDTRPRRQSRFRPFAVEHRLWRVRLRRTRLAVFHQHPHPKLDFTHQQAILIMQRHGHIARQRLGAVQVDTVGADVGNVKLACLVGHDGVAPRQVTGLIRYDPIALRLAANHTSAGKKVMPGVFTHQIPFGTDHFQHQFHRLTFL